MEETFGADAGAAGELDARAAAVASGEFIVYNTEDGRTEVQLRTVDGTVWLTQRQMAELFDKSVPTINEHIKTIYADGECVMEATIRKFRIVRSEGGREVEREIEHYNLDVVLAVGYRVRSPRGVQFRRWATTVLREYLIKGFAMNDARLKEPQGVDYFDELLARIRDIRASEKRFYQKVKEVFSASAVDYDPKAVVAQTFFKTIQNKLLFAVSGRTAAEIIVDRCDVGKPNMGLTSWKGSIVRKGDVDIAKNYLAEKEIGDLNRLTTMFLDFAEDRAARREPITMADWVTQTDRFLQFYERSVLRNAGSVSADEAKRISGERWEQFDLRRREIENEADDVEVLETVQREIERRSK
ncbi:MULTISPECIES: virulence RhuM family protein [unclassified Nocardia]|uniref:virulence RhuM family protein n=1 Tax=unclassified Nocardia TaxID=2637762 RepID=UPI001CE40D74|nr:MULTISPECIES: virulence RhuM family protein [unclassified Nocardia]